MSEKILSLETMYCELGGHGLTGFGEDAITIPSPESLVTSKKGLDSVAWLKVLNSSQELPVTVNLLADSPSVKFLKGFEKTGVIVPFRFEWEDLGVYVEALDARVEEKGELKVGTEMPEIQFQIMIKNFVEIKGL